MNKKYLPGIALALCLLLMSGCSTSTTTSESTSTETATAEETATDEMNKMSEDATELTYSGPAKFVTKTETYPCSEAAIESEACNQDPNGEVSTDWHYLQLPGESINAELLSYFKKAETPMEGEDYLVNLGCKNENQIQGDMYGTYDNPMLDEAFETGSEHQVEFVIDMNQPARGDIACLSSITEFVSVE